MVRPAHSDVNVLFTSVGRRVELLRAFRRAYAALGLGGRIVAVDIDPLAPALQEADRTYLVPRITAPDYLSTLASICQREYVNLIFPLIDPEIPILAHNRALIESTGAKLLVCSTDVIETVSDKWLTYQFLQRLGIVSPQSWLPDQVNAGQMEYPVFIKPRFGSAAKNTFKVRDADELAFFIRYVPNPIIQEYLPGPEITNDVICDLQGVVLAVVSRQRIEVRWGEVAKGVTVYNPIITEACIEIAEALPAIGPITVQCMMKDGIPHFTEINARLGGGVPLGIAAGVDSPRWFLAQAAGMQVKFPPMGSYQVGLHLTRFDDAYFLTEGDLDEIRSRSL